MLFIIACAGFSFFISPKGGSHLLLGKGSRRLELDCSSRNGCSQDDDLQDSGCPYHFGLL
jgi:hypothetical protein